jgi:NADPH:quinone reductase-like Zn-dependent oxidoreductase
MKAAVSRSFGPPDVVKVVEMPRPEPRDDEILVRVRAAAVGVVDGLARRGSPWYAPAHFGLLRPRFPVLGCDFAGQVEAAGPAVSRFGVGEAVFGTIAPRFGAPSPAIFAAMPWTARIGSRRAVVAFTGLRPAPEKQRDLLVIRDLAEASALVPVVGACYPLARIADAYRHVDAGHKKGTIVVTMS